MKLNDLISISKGEYRITLYEEGIHDPLCFTRNDWHGVDPYLDREVLSIEFSAEPRTMQGDVEILLAEKERCREGDSE